MILAPFLIGLVVSLVALVVVVVRGISLWRQAKRTGSVLTSELASFEERSARAERHLAEWERANAELERALAQLQLSRARLQVLLRALESAQGRVRWLRAFMPAP